MITKRITRAGAALASATLVLAACGSDDDTAADVADAVAEPADDAASDASTDADDAAESSSEPEPEPASDEDTTEESDVAEPADDDTADDQAGDEGGDQAGDETTDADGAATEPVDLPASLASDYLGSYDLMDEAFGTMVTVTVENGVRTIESNTLPDHETGEFPNSGNPNEITEQDRTWELPETGTNVGVATEVRETGVAVNGVKFEPGTAETLTCSSGETFRIEALQEMFDLGLDFNNAHVQPTGEYHYHGVSELLVGAYESDQDLVHIGFAADGNLIYYSKSGAYSSSYSLSDDARSGTDCLVSGPAGQTIDVEGTTPDGTYTEDFVFDAATGDLDECNGVEIDGQYVYLITDEYPYISRCVMGEVSAGAAGAGGGGGGAGAAPGEADDGAAPADAPDFSEAAEALGVTEDELLAALGNPPDVDAAAAALGISVDELTAVLPPPPGR